MNTNFNAINGFASNQQQRDRPRQQQPQRMNSNNNNSNDRRHEPSRLPKTKLVDRISSQESYNNNNNNVSNAKSRLSNKNGFVEKIRQRPIIARNLVNSRPAVPVKSISDTIGITPDLRKLLRPTKIIEDKRKSNVVQQQQNDDINGPYNFRKLLRPAEYLPTESLRKRKGGVACNGPPIAKDRASGKHVKRRAPLAPNASNKIVAGRA